MLQSVVSLSPINGINDGKQSLQSHIIVINSLPSTHQPVPAAGSTCVSLAAFPVHTVKHVLIARPYSSVQINRRVSHQVNMPGIDVGVEMDERGVWMGSQNCSIYQETKIYHHKHCISDECAKPSLISCLFEREKLTAQPQWIDTITKDVSSKRHLVDLIEF